LNRHRQELLLSALTSLNKSRNHQEDLAEDPLQFAYQYSKANDQELAAIISSVLAYGRVSLFLPIIESILTIANKYDGPYQWIIHFDTARSTELLNIKYRWNKHPDFSLLMFTLKKCLTINTSVGTLFNDQYQPGDIDIRPTLHRAITILRRYAVEISPQVGININTFSELPRGFKTFLSTPMDGSATKRWHLLLRWMVRKESPDLGLWNLPISKLCMPLDAHVHSISQMIGLTTQRNPDNKCVSQITTAMRQLCDTDPIRFDFALSHLGISRHCRKQWEKEICSTCSLQHVCLHSTSQTRKED